jgi:bifunctional non-homologous end joining protein LigD
VSAKEGSDPGPDLDRPGLDVGSNRLVSPPNLRGSGVATASANAREPLPRFVDPMLATLGALPLAGREEDWAYERKWDGVRAIVRWDGNRLALTSRNDIDMTVGYPELAALGDQLGGTQVVLDGEIVTLDSGGRSSFARLQKRMHVIGAAAATRLAQQEPVVLMIFDVLHLDGRSALALPYTDRRSILEGLQLSGVSWQTPALVQGNAEQAVHLSQVEGLEGIVAKRRASTYRPGQRSPDWTKLKNIRTQEVIVGGWRPGAGARAGTIGSLLLGLPGPDGLHYIGRVGTGFTATTLADLLDRLQTSSTTTSAFLDIPAADARDAHWVAPDLVGELAFAEWTPDGRLRQPAWRGLRPDKTPDQVVRES